MDALADYIASHGHGGFCPRTNNCLHFALGWLGLAGAVPDLAAGIPADWPALVRNGLARRGIMPVRAAVRGNFVITLLPDRNSPVCALRTGGRVCAKGRRGVTYWRPAAAATTDFRREED